MFSPNFVKISHRLSHMKLSRESFLKSCKLSCQNFPETFALNFDESFVAATLLLRERRGRGNSVVHEYQQKRLKVGWKSILRPDSNSTILNLFMGDDY